MSLSEQIIETEYLRSEFIQALMRSPREFLLGEKKLLETLLSIWKAKIQFLRSSQSQYHSLGTPE